MNQGVDRSGPVDPEDFVEYRLVRAAERMRRRFSAAVSRHGLTTRQFSVLAVLRARPGVTSAALARMVLTTPQSMHAQLEQLEQRRLLERGAARGRGRAAPIRLTASGQQLLDAAYPSVRQLEDQTRAVLGGEGYWQLVDLLGRLEGLDDPP